MLSTSKLINDIRDKISNYQVDTPSDGVLSLLNNKFKSNTLLFKIRSINSDDLSSDIFNIYDNSTNSFIEGRLSELIPSGSFLYNDILRTLYLYIDEKTYFQLI